MTLTAQHLWFFIAIGWLVGCTTRPPEEFAEKPSDGESIATADTDLEQPTAAPLPNRPVPDGFQAGENTGVPVQFVANQRPVNPINGRRAFGYLQAICNIGPRISGTKGMLQQQVMIVKHFQQLGAKVTAQEFIARDPLTRGNVKLTNLIVTWHPESKKRVLLCAHYDTRPLPDRDPNPVARRSGTFIGANDGASGTALLMELGHHMADLKCAYGVDFVLFDGEELVYNDRRDSYFLGSTHFAKEYRKNKPEHTYRWGVLLDMVGDANLQIGLERFSYSWRDTRPLMQEIWGTASRLGVGEFVPRLAAEVRDDHLPLRNTGKIPTCDIIDFDYPYWHTTQDVPANCSGDSLAKVGWVIHEWLSTTGAQPAERQ